MIRILTLAALATLFSTLVFAGSGHNGGHSHDDAPVFASGAPGDPHSVDREIRVEASDRMRFNPDDWTVQPGDTVRFVITNSGQIPHEFVIDTVKGNAVHRESMMEAMADGGMMDHDDPNAVTLEPGETDKLVWTFSRKGAFEAACNLPGHYQAGMKAEIDVTSRDLAHH